MKSTMKFLAGFLLAVVMVITMPGISYAQFGDLKTKAVETLTNGVMKELEKKYTEIIAKEAISATAKANIVNKLSEMSRPIVKKFIDSATSGKLPNKTELVNMVFKDILPRVPELVAAAIAEGNGLDTKTASTGAAGSTTLPTGQSPTAEQIQSAVNAQLQHNYDDEKDFTVEIINEGSAVRIIRYTGKNTELRIPPRIGDRPVTEIGERTFMKKGLVSVVIPESVIFIGNMAFAENQIGSVSIGANVYIANNAFDSSGNNSFSAGFYNNQGRKAGTYTNSGRLASPTTTGRPQVEETQADNKSAVPASSQKPTSGVKSQPETRPTPVSQPKPVTIAAIAGITVPVAGKKPVKTITGNDQYTGTVTWSPEVSGTFEPETQYTATITLTPKAGYTLEGVKANFFKVAKAVSTSNNDNSGVITTEFTPTKEEIPVYSEDKKYKVIGASIGTAFVAPLIIGTLHGTLAPFNGSFFDLGIDAGYGINRDHVDYFSLYPFVNFALFAPFPRTADGKRGGWYVGVGIGAMFANYMFDVVGSIWDNTIAMNIVTGFNLFDMFDISYTLRTNFTSADNKLSVGYVYRFK